MTPKQAYPEKLKDPRWQKVRLRVLERDEFYCQWCTNDKDTLHVHHLSYHGDLWDAPLDQLLTICESCHKEEHECRKAEETKLLLALKKCGFNYLSVSDIAKGFENYAPVHCTDVSSCFISWALSDEATMIIIKELFFEHLAKKSSLRLQNDTNNEQAF